MLSQRIQDTEAPIIVFAARIQSQVQGIQSLAQGFVYWQPPHEALLKLQKMVLDPAMNTYPPDFGIPPLREALRQKIQKENGLYNYDVMVTHGAQQAFINLICTFVDADDHIMLFKPYYFNHLLAVQMTGHAKKTIIGECDLENYHPDLRWLEEKLKEGPVPKMMVVCNPSNPSGANLKKEELQRLQELCSIYKIWLIIDNTYEYFMFDGSQHHALEGPNTVHVFSYSKSYGTMGWRIGYVAYPKFDKDDHIGEQLIKVQDSIPISASNISQQLGIACLETGSNFVKDNIKTVEQNRKQLMETMSILHGGIIKGKVVSESSIYCWSKLPEDVQDDMLLVEWLAKKHKIMTIPGTACGMPGHLRCSFANLNCEQFQKANQNLTKGFKDLVNIGYQQVVKDMEQIRSQEKQ